MKTSGKTKLIASRGRSGWNKEINQIKLVTKRAAIKKSITRAIASGSITPKGVGLDGPALIGVNLKAVGDLKRRKLLGRLVAASVRKKR